ncbi:MAG: teichoic acid transporter [Planctomycetota bacterium]|nr:MAG: teichoic acid transporter [Planctomycetota bacterium]
MSLNRRILLAVLANYGGRFAQIVLNLTLIPVMFRSLSPEEIGIWWIIGQSSMFLGLMDLGFGPTLTRRIAFAKGASGGSVDIELNEESRRRISDLAGTGRILYRYVALLVLLLAGGSGAAFLGSLELTRLSLSEVFFAWALICVGYAINTWGGFWLCLLGGLGYVGGAGFITVGFQIAGLVVKVIVVLCGGGLIGLAVTDCVAGLAARQATIAYLRWREPQVSTLVGCWSQSEFRSMLSPAIRTWLTALGAFLILRTNQYFIASFKGAEALPNYQAAYAAVSNLYIIAMSFSTASSVFYSQLWHAGEVERVHQLLARNLNVAMGTMICGSAALLFGSPQLFELWLGHGHFIGFPILMLFCVMLTLEAQHVVFSFASRATEDEAFALWALGAGFLNLAFTWSLIEPLGLLGVAVGGCLAQLLTNNWYVVLRAHYRLRLSLRTYCRTVLLPIGGLSAGVAAPLGAMMAVSAMPDAPWPRLTIVTFWCGLNLAAFVWLRALSQTERHRFLKFAVTKLGYRLGST